MVRPRVADAGRATGADRAPPPAKPKDDLAEVERALSVLGGHHPEHERARREIQEAVTKKRATDVALAHRAAKGRFARAVTAAIAVGVALAIAGGLWIRHAHKAAIERALEGPTSLFGERGFSTYATGEERIDAAIEPGCYIAVTPNDGDGALVVDHGGETLHGARSIGWCACTPERAVVTSKTPLRLLYVDGKNVGNVDGLIAAEPHPAVTSVRREECAEEQLEAWLDAKKLLAVPVDPAPFEAEEALAPLRDAGFAPLAVIPNGRAFAIVDGGAESCFFAWSRAEGDLLTLRIQGGARPIAAKNGPIAWCSEKARLVTVWRHGQGEVLVAGTQAARVGGMLGVRERADRARLAPPAAWIANDELAWHSVAILQGSGVQEAAVALSGNDPEARPGGDARLVAITTAPGGAFGADRRGDVPYYCVPKIEAAAPETLCAQIAPQAWRQIGAPGSIGIAQAPLPFWLGVLAPVRDADVTKSLTMLLALARRLRGDGFEPTTLAGVVEESSGVSVVGRAGDDAVVAVGLGPSAPWVFPYSDGVEWALDGEPRVVELKPGERVVLSSAHAPPVPRDQRRTVVFRRPARR